MLERIIRGEETKKVEDCSLNELTVWMMIKVQKKIFKMYQRF